MGRTRNGPIRRMQEVSGAHGIGKVRVVYRPYERPRVKWVPAIVVYGIFFSLMYLSYAWSKPKLREAHAIPALRFLANGYDWLRLTGAGILGKDVLCAKEGLFQGFPSETPEDAKEWFALFDKLQSSAPVPSNATAWVEVSSVMFNEDISVEERDQANEVVATNGIATSARVARAVVSMTSEGGLLAAQGFAHARDRLFQMDTARRAASGRLSELYGSKTVSADRLAHAMEWREKATEDWKSLNQEERGLLAAYTVGVNSFIRSTWAPEREVEEQTWGILAAEDAVWHAQAEAEIREGYPADLETSGVTLSAAFDALTDGNVNVAITTVSQWWNKTMLATRLRLLYVRAVSTRAVKHFLLWAHFMQYELPRVASAQWRLPSDFAYVYGPWRGLRLSQWDPIDTLAVVRMSAYESNSGSWEGLLVNNLGKAGTVGSVFGHLWKEKKSVGKDLLQMEDDMWVLPTVGSTIIAKSTEEGSILSGDIVRSNVRQSFLYGTELIKNDNEHSSGLSLPGVPYLWSSGRSSSLAWQTTVNAAAFTEDLFFLAAGAESSSVPLSTRTVDILVRLHTGDHITETVEIISAEGVGPDVSSFVDASMKSSMTRQRVAHVFLASQSREKQLPIAALRELTFSQSVTDVEAAGKKMSSVAWHIVYGTQTGEVGSVATGVLPQRGEDCPVHTAFCPLLPNAVWKSTNGESLTDKFSIPAKTGATIVAAEQSERIYSLLRQVQLPRNELTTQMHNILLDTFSQEAADEAKHLVSLLKLSDEEEEWRTIVNINEVSEVLQQWDGMYSLDASAPVVLEAFRSSLISLAIRSLGPMQSFLTGHNVTSSHRVSLYENAYLRNLVALTSDSSSSLYVAYGGLAPAVKYALNDAFKWLSTNYASTPAHWKWGETHRWVTPHAMSRSRELYDEALAWGPVPIGGSGRTVLATPFGAYNGLSFGRTAMFSINLPVSSYRLVVDLAQNGSTIYNLPVGVSMRHADKTFSRQTLLDFAAETPSTAKTCRNEEACKSEL